MTVTKELRPRINPENTTIDRFLESAAWAALILLWILVLKSYNKLPEIIPSHFNPSGQPDDTSNKNFIFILPVIGTFVFFLLTVLQNYPYTFNYPVKITADNAMKQYTNAIKMIRYLKLIILVVFGLITFFTLKTAWGESEGLGIWFLPVFLIGVFGPLAYYITKAFKNK